jgi:hypothetical protein
VIDSLMIQAVMEVIKKQKHAVDARFHSTSLSDGNRSPPDHQKPQDWKRKKKHSHSHSHNGSGSMKFSRSNLRDFNQRSRPKEGYEADVSSSDHGARSTDAKTNKVVSSSSCSAGMNQKLSSCSGNGSSNEASRDKNISNSKQRKSNDGIAHAAGQEMGSVGPSNDQIRRRSRLSAAAASGSPSGGSGSSPSVFPDFINQIAKHGVQKRKRDSPSYDGADEVRTKIPWRCTQSFLLLNKCNRRPTLSFLSPLLVPWFRFHGVFLNPLRRKPTKKKALPLHRKTKITKPQMKTTLAHLLERSLRRRTRHRSNINLHSDLTTQVINSISKRIRSRSTLWRFAPQDGTSQLVVSCNVCQATRTLIMEACPQCPKAAANANGGGTKPGKTGTEGDQQTLSDLLWSGISSSESSSNADASDNSAEASTGKEVVATERDSLNHAKCDCQPNQGPGQERNEQQGSGADVSGEQGSFPGVESSNQVSAEQHNNFMLKEKNISYFKNEENEDLPYSSCSDDADSSSVKSTSNVGDVGRGNQSGGEGSSSESSGGLLYARSGAESPSSSQDAVCPCLCALGTRKKREATHALLGELVRRTTTVPQ